MIEGLNSIPGVPTGSFAISLKLHHCVVDGMESVELMAAMHDLAHDSARPDPPEKPGSPALCRRRLTLSPGQRSTASSTLCAQARS